VTALMIVSQLCEEKARVLFRRCSFNFKGKSCLSYLSRYLALSFLSLTQLLLSQQPLIAMSFRWALSTSFLFKEENKKTRHRSSRLFRVCVGGRSAELM
jgi:hypothetical protein